MMSWHGTQPSFTSMLFMKHLALFLGALGFAGALASCTSNDADYPMGSTTSTSQTVGPPAYGSPYYVSSIVGPGPPYRHSGYYPYSPSHPDGMGYYERIPSPRGSYDYVYHDLAQPPPVPPLKEKTWRYTSRYPSTWGAPVWVTTVTPLHPARSSRSTASVAVPTTSPRF
jgi:hypothetical protein